MKKQQLNVVLDPEDLKRIREMAETANLSLAAIVRSIVHVTLEKLQEPTNGKQS